MSAWRKGDRSSCGASSQAALGLGTEWVRTKGSKGEKSNGEKKVGDFDVGRVLSMWEGIICKTRVRNMGQRRGN